MNSEQRSCLSKVRYTQQRGACQAMIRTRLDLGLGQRALQVYLCRFCKGWHVGHAKTGEPIRKLRRR